MKKIIILLIISFNAFSFQPLTDNDTKSKFSLNKSTQYIKNLATSGDIKAQFELANMYHTGIGIEKNDMLSFYWYKQVAQKGFENAQFNIANSYYNGYGVEKNIDTAIYWYKKAANKNLTPAMYNLAFVLKTDKKNLDQSFFWYKKAADLGHGESQLIVAKIYQNGTGVEKNNSNAELWFKSAIKNNIKNANYAFAEFLITTDKNLLAIDFYKKSSLNNSALANYKLANLYLNGKVVKQNKEQALQFLKKAAQQEYPPAQQLLGLIYGIDKDYKNSVIWYKKAADGGNTKAQYNLGVLYFKGIGVKKDIYKSIELFIKAANGGNTSAQYSLAIRYLKGIGIEKNYYEATKWLKRAAKKNHPNATYSLALRYKLAQGIEKDEFKYIFWLKKSAKLGNQTAQYELAVITLLGKKTNIDKNIAIKDLDKLTTDKKFSSRANYYLGKFYLKTKPTLSQEYLTKSSKDGYKPAIKLLEKFVTKIDKKPTIATNIQKLVSNKNQQKLDQKIIKKTQITPQQEPKSKKIVEKKSVKQSNIEKLVSKDQQILNQKVIKKMQVSTLQQRQQEAESIYRLAISYLNNSQNNYNFITAFNTMYKSATLGFPPAQSDIALMYLNGMGVMANLDKALYFAKLAKKNNYLPATQILIYIQNAKNRSR